MFDLRPGSPEAYALTSVDFAALARAYGKMGGLDRVATIVKRVRGERPDKTLFLDGGDTWQGSYTANATAGADMVRSEEHKSELQSLMRNSYDVLCLKKKKQQIIQK